ncbi:MAG TPA: hypothetical protein VIH03_01545 [Nitrososphaerales archaeon]
MLLHNRKDSKIQETYRKGINEGFLQGKAESQAKIREQEGRIFELEERMKGAEAQINLVGRLLTELINGWSEIPDEMRRKVLDSLNELGSE